MDREDKLMIMEDKLSEMLNVMTQLVDENKELKNKLYVFEETLNEIRKKTEFI